MVCHDTAVLNVEEGVQSIQSSLGGALVDSALPLVPACSEDGDYDVQ
jgi:hypothetical protein